ncbi:ABC transporter permease [Streptodolium elevatio]|uniref:ABC transporter permease n=1 Tax=Streptodolium elevatio TaxID=3157996 RepID=A0ABV3DEW0_9ACTN
MTTPHPTAQSSTYPATHSPATQPPTSQPSAPQTPARQFAALRRSFGSEWIKLWTVRSTWWALSAAVVLMTGVAAIMGGDFAGDVEKGEVTDGTSMGIAEPAADAAMLAQFGLIAFAMLAVTGEFGTGAIRGTLCADPRRGRVLLAKTLAVSAVVVPLAFVLALLGLVAGDVTLGEYGTGGTTVEDVAATTVYLVLAAVFTVGVGALLRNSVGTLSAVIVLLLALPITLGADRSAYLPGGAGLNLLGGEDPPYSRLTAAVLFALWTVAAQLAGYASLRRRDV